VVIVLFVITTLYMTWSSYFAFQDLISLETQSESKKETLLALKEIHLGWRSVINNGLVAILMYLFTTTAGTLIQAIRGKHSGN